MAKLSPRIMLSVTHLKERVTSFTHAILWDAPVHRA